jgi:hypothetical protein
MQLCEAMNISQELDPPPPKRGGDVILGSEEEAEETGDAQEDEDGEGEESEGGGRQIRRQIRTASPSSNAFDNDVDMEETSRALNYNAILRLAEQLDRIGLIDPADDLEAAQVKET